MKRASRFFRDAIRGRDWLALLIAGFAIFICCWVVAILFSPQLQEIALRRFQLANNSFPLWVAHQAVPSMYNYENRVRFSRRLTEEGDLDESDEDFRQETLNHFPARYITFGWPRGMLFREKKQGFLEMTSAYRDQQLTSRWTIRPDESGVLAVTREFQRMEGCPR
jgi:hypothetical protein